MPKNYYMPSFNDEYAIPEGLIAGIGSPDNLSGLTQQPDASRVAGAYDYVPLYGAGDIVPGLTAEIFKNLGIENPNVPVFELLGSENKGGKNANERMTFAAQPGQEYRLVNKATGEVLGQASTPEGISALVQQSNALSKQLGKKADIAFEQSIPEALGGGFTPIFRDEPNKVAGGLLGTVMDVGIPTLAALAVPGAGLLGTILPAAGGTAASSLAQGRGLGETLIRSVISGAGAGLGDKFLAPALDKVFAPAASAATQAGTQAATKAATQAATQAISGGGGGIIVNALPSLVSRGLTTGLTSLATNLLPSAFDASQFAQPTQVQQPAQTEYTAPPENIILTAPEQVAPSLVPAVAGGVSNALLDQVASPTAPSDEIVVTAKDAEPINFGDVAPVLLPSVGAALASSIGATATPPLAEPVADKGFLGTGLSASELLTLSGAGLAGLQGLIGGGGGGGGARAPDTTGLTFRPSTLRPTTRAVGIGGAGGRYPYTPTTYGRAGGDQEAEYLFFTHEPLPSEPASAPAAPGKKEGGEMHGDMVKHLVEYHKNGGHYGPGQVKGIGSGQEDLIPAWLSDGEYVWSAQDVADLGDGSTDEGVRRLDKMRQMVRRQAGRKDVKKIAKPQKGIDKMLKAVGGLA